MKKYFRARDVKTNKFIYGALVEVKDKEFIRTEDGQLREFKTATIGMCSGKKDSTGQKIFGKDIISYKEMIFKVSYCPAFKSHVIIDYVTGSIYLLKELPSDSITVVGCSA